MRQAGEAVIVTTPGNGSNVTPRELYSTLDSIKTSLTAQIQGVQTTVESKLSELRADIATSQTQHEQEHQRDRDRRNSLIRWAVTTVITFGGVIVAIYAAMKGSG